jgi:hypothetical protein
VAKCGSRCGIGAEDRLSIGERNHSAGPSNSKQQGPFREEDLWSTTYNIYKEAHELDMT